ncbi:hypothetical protein BH23BAC1_BH23BAC1_40800 [soil metagenome]
MKLKRFLSTLISYINPKKKLVNIIPLKIDDAETIVRSVFSPINIHKKKGSLLSNTFRSPHGLDEVSVNRLDYTTVHFCKTISLKIEDPDNRRSYFGFATLKAKEIRETKSEVFYTPILEPEESFNEYHSDIKIGYISLKGEPLPAEFQLKVDELTSMAKLYKDPDPNSLEWKGEPIT